ncbi:MAG: VWA domain-containing protein [Phocaeicola sp.]|nr:VWA domain-containing protein [Phocaeicola sp.]
MSYHFSQLVGYEEAYIAIIMSLIRQQGATLLLSGRTGSGKSMLLGCVESLFAEQIVRLPLSTSIEMLEGQMLPHSQSGHTGLVQLPGLLDRMRGRIVLIEHINLHARELIAQLFAMQDRLVGEEAFSIIATTNPEEGAISTALLDRFDLYVDLHATQDVEQRVRIIKEAMRPSKPSDGDVLRQLVEVARQRLAQVKVTEEMQLYVSQVCAEAYTLGHRAELALSHSAMAWAAWLGKKYLERSEINTLRQMALQHRLINPSTTAEDSQDEEQSQDEPQDADAHAQEGEPNKAPQTQDDIDTPSTGQDSEEPQPSEQDRPNPHQGTASEEQSLALDNTYLVHNPIAKAPRRVRRRVSFGRRLYSTLASRKGRSRSTRIAQQKVQDLSLPATIMAAIPYQYIRRERTGQSTTHRLLIKRSDYRVHRRQRRGGYHILFVLDCSGSMGVNKRMAMVKATILELLKESYTKRDSIGLITFAQDEANLLLPFTKSAERAARLLTDIKTGGRTPLWLALEQASKYLQSSRRLDADMLPIVLVLTDGRATSSMKGENKSERIVATCRGLATSCSRRIVIDTESGFIRLGKSRELAEHLDGEYYRLDDISRIQEVLTIK